MVLKSAKNRRGKELELDLTLNYNELKELYNKLRLHLNLVEENKDKIPVNIFSSQTSSLEAIVKYLHENLNLTFTQIAKELNRSAKTIYQAYNKEGKIVVADYSITIPINIFSDRKLSILEHIVFFLKTKLNLRLSHIAKLLHRDSRTIWTVYNRAKQK